MTFRDVITNRTNIWPVYMLAQERSFQITIAYNNVWHRLLGVM